MFNRVRLFWCATSISMLAIPGCKNQASPAPPPQSPSVIQKTPQPVTQEPTSDRPVLEALNTMLSRDAEKDKILPAGVKVNSVTVSNHVATIDFSSEFSALANSGETVESEAQKLICRTIGKFRSIDRLRVTVDGRSFDSQATDWYSPFPVRGTASATTASGRHPE